VFEVIYADPHTSHCADGACWQYCHTGYHEHSAANAWACIPVSEATKALRQDDDMHITTVCGNPCHPPGDTRDR
jgi:hypothetical protein